ncbi:MAG: hypothetical protein OXD32_08725, partial [Endozoicomonadaceae bacterium]|nr:hypothetical protein [Endozoicomonadaceae bacterium]
MNEISKLRVDEFTCLLLRLINIGMALYAAIRSYIHSTSKHWILFLYNPLITMSSNEVNSIFLSKIGIYLLFFDFFYVAAFYEQSLLKPSFYCFGCFCLGGVLTQRTILL